jgi:hypothetical protein
MGEQQHPDPEHPLGGPPGQDPEQDPEHPLGGPPGHAPEEEEPAPTQPIVLPDDEDEEEGEPKDPEA